MSEGAATPQDLQNLALGLFKVAHLKQGKPVGCGTGSGASIGLASSIAIAVGRSAGSGTTSIGFVTTEGDNGLVKGAGSGAIGVLKTGS